MGREIRFGSLGKRATDSFDEGLSSVVFAPDHGLDHMCRNGGITWPGRSAGLGAGKETIDPNATIASAILQLTPVVGGPSASPVTAPDPARP